MDGDSGQTIRSNFKSIHAENRNLMIGGN